MKNYSKWTLVLFCLGLVSMMMATTGCELCAEPEAVAAAPPPPKPAPAPRPCGPVGDASVSQFRPGSTLGSLKPLLPDRAGRRWALHSVRQLVDRGPMAC